MHMNKFNTRISWGPLMPITLVTLVISVIRSIWIVLVVDNVLSWKLGFRGHNEQDDVEGPFYLVGAPHRQIDVGKGVVASIRLLKKHGPFLFIFDVKDSKGDPVPNAALDWWQADSNGGYYFATWTLRGQLKTDAHGRAEVLSIRPGDYATRPGHVHLAISGTPGKHRDMTTQAYVCRNNDALYMLRDIPRFGNRVACWAIPTANGGELYWGFPELPANDVDAVKRVGWWNAKLKEQNVGREIIAVGRHEAYLNVRTLSLMEVYFQTSMLRYGRRSGSMHDDRHNES
ncbi:Intradiol ring-cleavage dioxygenase [Lenzites betulinus]|nr:Intradiol ring-cleavage dioxygenase [Lenzites betulinus]